jgi:hypothetical protein
MCCLLHSKDAACATAPIYSTIYQIGVCQSSGFNTSLRATVVTAPGGATVMLGLQFNGTKCAGRQTASPVVVGNTSTVCGVDSDAYTTVLYSAAVGIAAGNMQG